jgi:hypothetical protein
MERATNGVLRGYQRMGRTMNPSKPLLPPVD